MAEQTTAPPVPRRFTKARKVEFWGATYTVRPLLCGEHLGDGRRLLWFEPLNTRPDYYLIRVDSSWCHGDDPKNEDLWDHMDDIIDTLAEEFSEKEREREALEQDLIDRGIEPDGDNTDLAGNEDRLGWPVLSLDSGYSWGTMAVWDGKRWKEK